MFCETPDIERSANIVWDVYDGYFVVFPEQMGTSVTACFVGYMENEIDFIVLQLHSHGRLQAFFSSTDDADEIRTGFYGVIGECHELYPQATFRFSCGGKFVKINPYELFEGEMESVVFLV
ncbi:hypothetical protein LSG31_18575 [Fodinisporobacter ferrooxydans]|uniref:JAB domain-containing protein n=1 Tax=Fodinisporobacter ferrooxydans TaxID=2901836 RepID=A0ABY4CKT2_9BACL|nr:hypothetical protein LSG31_18575 [Alicyclobacillaceae bacterium MYW30-H2]